MIAGLGGRGVVRPGLGVQLGGAVAAPWWLAGGISAADCIAAYQPRAAASYAASLINLNNPGTYNAVPVTEAPDWTAVDGWIGKAGCTGMQVTTYTTTNLCHSMIGHKTGGVGWGDKICWASGTNRLQIAFGPTGPVHSYIHVTGPGWLAGASDGVYAMRLDDAPLVDARFYAGVLEASNFTTTLTGAGQTLYCGPQAVTTFKIRAMAWYKRGLTDVEFAAIRLAILAL